MILVRNTFQLKFGAAKQAVALWKEGKAMMKDAGFSSDPRLLTDLTGPSYTLVMEGTFESLSDYESKGPTLMGKPEWQDWYQRFVPLAESGHREIFNVVD